MWNQTGSSIREKYASETCRGTGQCTIACSNWFWHFNWPGLGPRFSVIFFFSETSSAIRKPNLNSCFRQVKPLRKLLSGVHIRVMSLGESFFKFIYLLKGKFRATTSWLTTKKQLLVSISREKCMFCFGHIFYNHKKSLWKYFSKQSELYCRCRPKITPTSRENRVWKGIFDGFLLIVSSNQLMVLFLVEEYCIWRPLARVVFRLFAS